jgi:hypothetical protein
MAQYFRSARHNMHEIGHRSCSDPIAGAAEDRENQGIEGGRDPPTRGPETLLQDSDQRIQNKGDRHGKDKGQQRNPDLIKQHRDDRQYRCDRPAPDERAAPHRRAAPGVHDACAEVLPS